MRISDIILEEPGVLSTMRKDYQRGFDAVDRVLNPKRWGQDDAVDSKASSGAVNKLDLRDAVNSVIAGSTIYERDQQVLKQAHAQIKAGKFSVNQDAEELLAALQAAIKLQKLAPQQQQVLSAFAKDL